MNMRENRTIFIFIFLAFTGLTTASIGRFLPFSGFYPIPGKTPEPINIVTKRTYPLFTFGPLTFKGNNGEENAFIRNTGSSLQVFEINSTTTVTVSGGPLYGNIYRFRQTIFYWANSTEDVAYTTVNGKHGTPLEVAVVYVNLKYGELENAVRFRNGLVTVLFRIQIKPESNPKFDALADAIKHTRQPGPLVPIQLADSFRYFKNIPRNTTYFAYPGSYKNETTGETYYCTTTIPIDPNPTQFISAKQFQDSFLTLLKYDGSPLINQRQQKPRGLRPVARSRGVVLEYSDKPVYYSSS